jgi:medium-chain acyl-[acyl-carrier-protein] hydrolase
MNGKSATSSWFAFPRRNPQARLRLFCFPHAGGGSSIFRSWPAELPLDIEVSSALLPGRESRLKEPPFTRIAPLVKEVGDVILNYLDKPFAFFGHSMGAFIAFELIHELKRRNATTPTHLFVSGAGAPQIPDPEPPIHHLPEAEFRESLRRLNGTPQVVLDHPELMELMVPLLRADFAVYETYSYLERPPLACPISAFTGIQDGRVSLERAEAWRAQTTGRFVMRTLPGDHFFLQTAQADLIRSVAQDLQGYGTLGRY